MENYEQRYDSGPLFETPIAWHQNEMIAIYRLSLSIILNGKIHAFQGILKWTWNVFNLVLTRLSSAFPAKERLKRTRRTDAVCIALKESNEKNTIENQVNFIFTQRMSYQFSIRSVECNMYFCVITTSVFVCVYIICFDCKI